MKLPSIFILTFGFCSIVNAQTTPAYPNSQNDNSGDHLRLPVDLYGFDPVSRTPDVTNEKLCAGKDTSYSVSFTDKDNTYVKFYTVEKPESAHTCPGIAEKDIVATGSVYKIATNIYQTIAPKRTGLAYGALVVPFKFRLGNDKKLVSSSTIAPFIGIRWSKLQGFGYEFMPVIAAGVGLVPVADPVTNTTETKSAFSTSLGITLTSTRNTEFSAGLLVGKDFLSRSDRLIDPTVNKPWISIWLGVSR